MKDKDSFNEYELERKIKNGSENVKDYRFLGKIYLDRGDYNKLLDLYEKALSLPLSEGERAVLICEKGQALDLLGKKEMAVCCFKQSLDLLNRLSNDGDLYSYLDLKGLNHYNLFLLYGARKGHQYAELAVDEFELFLKREPNSEENCKFHSCLADLYLRLEKNDKAIELLEKGFEIRKDLDWKINCLSGMASAYINKKDFVNAERCLKQALSAAHGNLSALSNIYYNIGRMYFESSRTAEAIAAFDNSLKYKKDDPALIHDKEYLVEILWHLGNLAYDDENCDKAIDYCAKVLEKTDKNSIYYCDCHITLAHCYLMKEDYANARKHYNMVLSSPYATKEEIKVVKESLSRCPLDS